MLVCVCLCEGFAGEVQMYRHCGHDAAEEERDLHIWQAQTGSGRNDQKVHLIRWEILATM